jgi:hypothetical protein
MRWRHKSLRRIPIVDHENRVIGIMTQANVALRVDQPVKTGELLKELSQN